MPLRLPAPQPFRAAAGGRGPGRSPALPTRKPEGPPAGTFPGQTQRLKDNSHHSPYGAYELARCIVRGIREYELPLAQHLREGPRFDPAQPDDPDAFIWPDTPPTGPLAKPEGS